jgi:hypothetical protein
MRAGSTLATPAPFPGSVLRLYGHGLGLGKMFGFHFSEISIIRIFPDRLKVLAPLAHLALDLVPGLPLDVCAQKHAADDHYRLREMGNVR